MKFKVDAETCIACGACEGTCPEVFEVDEHSTVIVEEVSEALQASALEAEADCPVGAISHT